MKTNQKTNRGQWARQQQTLRRLLMKEKDFRKALPIFLNQHAAVHTAKLDQVWSYQDEVLSNLTGEQMRHTPKGSAHSIIWSLWHITRIEDVTINILLADASQVLHSGGWIGKLKAPFEDVGNELSPEEIAALNEAVDVKALLAYRLAVGKRTRMVMYALDPEALWVLPAPGRMKRIREEGAVNEKENWLLKYWGGHPAANLLLMPATRHPFVHLNEIQRMLPKLHRLQDK